MKSVREMAAMVQRIGMVVIVFLGALSEARAAEPILIVKCSSPSGAMITFKDGAFKQSNDGIKGDKYTIIFYKPGDEGENQAVVIIEGQNNLNEQGHYRVYGNSDSLVAEVNVYYNQATWIYSYFAKDRLLFIHSSKTGIIGNPTAHLMAAKCE